MSASDSGDDNLFGYYIWLGVAALALFFLGPKAWNAVVGKLPEVTAFAKEWAWIAVAVGLGLVAFVVARVWAHVRARRRAERVAILAARLERVMPAEWAAQKHLRIRRWAGATPRVVRVDLPPVCRDDDPAWRIEVVRAASSVMGALAPVRWPDGGRQRRIELRRRPAGDMASDAGQDASTQTDQVTTALAGLVPSPRVSVDDLPSGRRITVRFGETTRDQSPQWRHRVTEQISARTGQRWRPRWDRASRTVTFEPVPELPAEIRWADTAAAVRALAPGRLLAPYGVDELGRWVCWEIGDRAPHTLVVGETGTGKTETLKAMALSALAAGCLVAICDPKLGKNYAEFLGRPGVVALAGSIEDLAAALLDLTDEMKRRLAAHSLREVLDQHPGLADQFPLPETSAVDTVPLIIIIDEVTQMNADLRSWWATVDKEDRPLWGAAETARQPPVLHLPGQFAQLARSIKMHLIAGMQRGDADNFGDSTQMRDNLPHRVSMGATSPISSEMIWDDRAVGSMVEIASIGEGVSNGIRVNTDGTLEYAGPSRFKAMWTADTAKSEEFWAQIDHVVPDASLVALPRVSAASKDPAAAAAALFERAYHGITGSSADVATRGDTGGITADAQVQTSTPKLTVVREPDPEVDGSGLSWEYVLPTALGAGDLVQLGECESALVEELIGPQTDEFSGDEVFRIAVVVAGESQIVDLGDEELVYRARCHEGVEV